MFTPVQTQPQLFVSPAGDQRAAIIAEWRHYTRRTIQKLKMFDDALAWLQRNRERGPVTEEAFNELLALLADAGLLDWADGSPLDTTDERPNLDALANALGV